MIKEVKPRFELKYRLSKKKYYEVFSSLRPFVRPDHFSSGNSRYTVRSLYYDDPQYTAYIDKMAGVYWRDKYRIRAYSSDKNEIQTVKIEKKTRIGSLIYKEVNSVSLAVYEFFKKNGTWDSASGNVLDELSYLRFRNHLQPLTVVDYQRDAYFAQDGSGIRFSFDHDIRYAHSGDLFCEESKFRNNLENSVIFEIKTPRDDIGWVSEIIQQVDISPEPNSKYANSFEHTVNDVW
jgi:hypothetical protein